MSTYTSPRRIAWSRHLAVLAGVLMVGYWAACLGNVGSQTLNLLFTVVMVLIVPVGVWAVRCAPQELRRFAILALSALVFQVIGSVLWELAYVAHPGARTLPQLGPWTAFLYVALLLALWATWTGVREVLHPRDALLDYSIVVAAAASVAVVVIQHHGSVGVGWSPAAVDAIVRPLLSLLVVVIVSSAALGRWQTLPLQVGLVGICELLDAAGFLWVSYYVSHGAYTSDRWPNLLWFTALIFALGTCLAFIAGIDRPLRLSRDPLPGVSPTPLVVVALAALSAAGASAAYGILDDDTASLYAGLAAIAWIGVAALFRTGGALAEARGAYRRLDQAHFELEQQRERAEELVAERDQTIEDLAQRNVVLTAAQTMLGQLLETADERSDGLLRAKLEQTGNDLSAWLALRRPD